MASQHERRFQPKPLSNTSLVSGGDATRIRITRVNARAPMSRMEQRVALLIWVGSICLVLLTLSEIIKLIYRTAKAFIA
ncbi:MAG: hypothetical protein EOP36_10085 [Rubrivivax sp.]|nr:MAG: hypothetical protein EOP36_10085 [Rubrivivax sp.]